MSGEIDLPTLLTGLSPRLHGGVFCFVTAAEPRRDLGAVATVAEEEGWSLLVPVERAEAAGLTFDGRFRWITLRVHSSLAAVGLTAAVAAALAEAGIAANVIAGRFHDHVLVPEDRAGGGDGAARRSGRAVASPVVPPASVSTMNDCFRSSAAGRRP